MGQTKRSEGFVGLLMLLGSQVTFSLVIFYWKQIHTDPLQTLCNRMLWSWVVALLCVLILDRKEKSYRQVLENHRQLFSYLAGGLLLGVNWGTYLYCVNSGNIVESSLGYFINPLLICLAGIFIYKERVTPYNATAILLGLAGVLYITFNYGRAPIWALLLAGTYSLYTVIKRNYPAKPYVSMFFETTALLPIALIYFGYLIYNGDSAFLQMGSSSQPYWLMLAGVMTLTPLMMYAVGLRTASMMVVGITSYISPCLSLLIGVACYNEAFTPTHAVSFSLVWLGVIIFTIGNFKEHRRKQEQKEQTAAK